MAPFIVYLLFVVCLLFPSFFFFHVFWILSVISD